MFIYVYVVHNLYCSFIFITVTKWRRVRWPRQIACMEMTRKACPSHSSTIQWERLIINLPIITSSMYQPTKVKMFLCMPLEGIYGSGDAAPPILNHCTRWTWMVSIIPQLLYNLGECPISNEYENGSGHFRVNINSLPLPGTEPQFLCCSAHSLVTILTMPSWPHISTNKPGNSK